MPKHDSYFIERESSTIRRILLMPAMPTPNGRVHLGHIAGPFMRMDILNRHFRTRGHDSLFCTGVDAFESHVLLRAHRDGVTALETCARFGRLIFEDLEAALVQCDRFINPVDEDSREEFGRWNEEVLEQLKRSGAIRTRSERIPRGLDSGRVIAGCWISGECPLCGTSASGYCCSSCGYHFRPDELRHPKPREWDEPLEWLTVPSLFLEIAAIEPLLQVRPKYPKALAKVQSYLEKQRNLVRLSAPGEWGVPIHVEGSAIPQVAFSYTAIGFQLMVGDSFRALRSHTHNGFDREAEIEVVGGFGSDNVIPFFVGMQGSLVAAGYKPFGHFLINEMMHLEGEPFTTSGGHAIWVSELVNTAGIHADVLRNYLSRVNPEEHTTNFRVDGVVDTARSLAERWGCVQSISDAVREVERVPPLTGELLARLGDALRRQDETLDLTSGVRIALLPALIDEWLEGAGAALDAGNGYWWLKGLALLAYPLMPGWSQAQWTALGHEGIPRCSEFREPRRPTGAVLVRYTPVRRNDVASCMPEQCGSSLAR